MCDRVPVWKANIIAGNFSKNFTGKDMDQNDNLKAAWKRYSQPFLKNRRQQEQEQHQYADKYVFVITFDR